jgi:hypothetical protein
VGHLKTKIDSLVIEDSGFAVAGHPPGSGKVLKLILGQGIIDIDIDTESQALDLANVV